MSSIPTIIEVSIQNCQTGRLDAFSVIYEHFIEKMYRFVFHKTMDDTITEDIVSDVFFKALKHIETFSGRTEQELSSWLYRIAYNSVIDHYRTQKEHTDLEVIEETHGTSPEYAENLDNAMTLEGVLGYLDTLPKEQKDIIIMRVWDDLSYKEIAEITGKSVDACKKTVSRVMAQ
ncbi:MAG: RNA polymerase sigma factor, partial [Candidatus Gracilibacteria bacterium]|nr:RNA polymerase sigma factor [Candidatus Gracilibacteria bacterium]